MRRLEPVELGIERRLRPLPPGRHRYAVQHLDDFFVRKTSTKAHGKLVDQLRRKAQAATATEQVLKRSNTLRHRRAAFSPPQTPQKLYYHSPEKTGNNTASPSPQTPQQPYYYPQVKNGYATAPPLLPKLPKQPQLTEQLRDVYGVYRHDSVIDKPQPYQVPRVPPAPEKPLQYTKFDYQTLQPQQGYHTQSTSRAVATRLRCLSGPRPWRRRLSAPVTGA